MVQSLRWSGFWSEFFSDHGLSFLPRGQKHWGRGRRVSIDFGVSRFRGYCTRLHRKSQDSEPGKFHCRAPFGGGWFGS